MPARTRAAVFRHTAKPAPASPTRASLGGRNKSGVEKVRRRYCGIGSLLHPLNQPSHQRETLLQRLQVAVRMAEARIARDERHVSPVEVPSQAVQVDVPPAG